MEGWIEVTGRQGIRRKQLLNDLERQDTGNSNRKYQIALCGEFGLKRLWTSRNTD